MPFLKQSLINSQVFHIDFVLQGLFSRLWNVYRISQKIEPLFFIFYKDSGFIRILLHCVQTAHYTGIARSIINADFASKSGVNCLEEG